MSTKELVQELDEKVKAIYKAVREAENFAIEHKLDFGLSIEYGMGGYFDGEEGSWQSSTASCY